MIEKIYGGLAALGAAGAITALAVSPQALPGVAVGTGGLLGGASLTHELVRKRRDEAEESARVGAAFSALYAANKGLVNPQQLSLLTAVSLERIDEFLQRLSEAQGGKYIQVEAGAFYTFPHPNNILDELTNNANAWARDTTEGLRQENASLLQQLNLMRAATASNMISNAGGYAGVPDLPRDVEDPWVPNKARALN